jgi:hypothetical protein
MPADHHGCCNPPELELPAPPPCPAATARTGPRRPRSGPAAMRDLGQQGAATSTACPPHGHHTPPCAAARRPAAALDHRRRPGRSPIRRDAEDERDPTSVVGGASFARPRPPTEAEGRDGRGAARRRRLGFGSRCRPSGGDTGGRGAGRVFPPLLQLNMMERK